MVNNIYDRKVVIVDLDFSEINQYSLDESLYTKKLLSELAANQNLILLTDSPAFLAIEILKNLDLKTGYLIADAGASIINIATSKTIQEEFLNPSLVHNLCYKCVWNNLLFSINTDKNKYPFKISRWIIKKYKGNLSYLMNYEQYMMETSSELQELIHENNVRTIEIYFPHKTNIERKKAMMEFITCFENEFNYTINVSTLQIIPKGKTKENALRYLAEDLRINSKADGIYCSVHQCYSDIIPNTYFSAITDECKEKKDAKEQTLTDISELIPWGTVSWIDWFYKNAHLWWGNQEEKLKEVFEKYKDYCIEEKELKRMQSEPVKYITLTKTTLYSVSQNKMAHQRIDSVKLGFWPQQAGFIVNFITKHKMIQRKP
ncbi:HAD hydrolase family protein [Candidatus Mycoplasma haematohominis]|uniref:Haloacid dehalogenase-like hydrolase n=1 Tax=Candidatus Mycoplasma haematohominis TaxID=1494318 RepID=A0A478FT11_9MOLU|nr:HAD hydrolase family protein [Candidatus Mycoplasma haemohominis]GCE63225.1 haloacid dehalogenase-like hydrolase [Candidatus Mycoplasma haemohominis]